MLPEPYYQDELVTLYCGDVREILPLLSADLVQTVVTSPPYFGLRDYETGRWEGGTNPSCKHQHKELRRGVNLANSVHNTRGGAKKIAKAGWILYKGKCKKCGAVRVDQQIGLEKTPAEYFESIVGVFDEIRRVLRPDGTVWLNVGDNYAHDNKWGGATGGKHAKELHGSKGNGRGKTKTGLKGKNLCGLPWRMAFALQDADWCLRSEIIWFKPNPIPESMSDRPTKAHDQIFLLAAAPKYFSDFEAIKEPASVNTHPRRALADKSKPVGSWAQEGEKSSIAHNRTKKGSKRKLGDHGSGIRSNHSFDAALAAVVATRNVRTVWQIATEPNPYLHFATFPSALPERCIKAGTSERQQCAKCGSPYKRIVRKISGSPATRRGSRFDTGKTAGHRPGAQSQAKRDRSFDWSRNGKEGTHSTLDTEIPQTTTIGWRRTCKCHIKKTVPQIVLDPKRCAKALALSLLR